MKRHLQYNWMKYLAVLLLPLLLWPTAFRLRERQLQGKQLSILFVGEGLDTVQLQDALSEQTHKTVRVAQAVPGALPYHEFLTAHCFHYDLLILSEDWMQENVGQRFFSRVPETLAANFQNAQPYQETIEGTPLLFGYVLGDTARFSDYLSDTVCCYLFFSPESYLLSTDDDTAILTAQFLLEDSH